MNRHILRPAVEQSQRRRIARAERTADAAELAVRQVWNQLLAIIEAGGPWMLIYQRVQKVTERLAPTIIQSIAAGLTVAAHDTHAETIRTTFRRLPRHTLQRLVVRRRLIPAGVMEADVFGLPEPDPEPLQVGEIFPAFDFNYLSDIIHSSGWMQRIESLSRLGDAGNLASRITNGLAQGWTPGKIARDIRPLLQGVQSSARRVARTETVRVAGEIQLGQWDELGDMVIGYQVHSVHGNPASRKWHLDRDGTEYFKRPGPGQKGMQQMPRPPMEAPDPAERPAGTPQVAPNCLCYLTPILRD